MSFKNKSTENKLKQLSTLGPNLFAGKFFDLLHDSAENIRDAKETQHLRKIKVVDKQESKPSNLHVGAKRHPGIGSYLLPFVDKILYMTPYLGLILG
jgi:hypothetical protein